MIRTFVYRICGSRRWAVTKGERHQDYEFVNDYGTWQEAFDEAFRIARQERARYRSWWPPKPNEVHAVIAAQ